MENTKNILKIINDKFILLEITENLMNFVFSSFTSFFFGIEYKLNSFSIDKFLKENTYIVKFIDLIKQNHISKYEEIRSNLNYIETSFEDASDKFNHNVLMFLLNYKILKNFHKHFSVVIQENHNFCVELIKKDEEYLKIIDEIEKLINNEIVYNNVLLLISNEIFINQFETLIVGYNIDCKNKLHQYKEHRNNKLNDIYSEI